MSLFPAIGESVFTPGRFAGLAGLIPRNATPWEHAAAILIVASPEASDMTGALVASDGGWTAF